MALDVVREFLSHVMEHDDDPDPDPPPDSQAEAQEQQQQQMDLSEFRATPPFVVVFSSDVMFAAIIVIMAVILVILWMDYRRRKLSDMLSHPAENLPEVKEHLQEAIREMAEFVVPRRSQRFRKRDRFYFLGRRFARRLSENASSLRERGSNARQRAISRLTKNFLLYSSSSSSDSNDGDTGLQVQQAGLVPAEQYLDDEDDEDVLDEEYDDASDWITPELSYLLSSFHMFGHFDKAMFLELSGSIERISVPAGQYLFKVGDADEYVHVIQSGKMDVYIVEQDNRTTTIKSVRAGETVSSLLSFIDVLTGCSNSCFKTVCCKATMDSVVIRVPASAFKKVFDRNPEMLIRVVQLIMARLQRVCFLALHQYLGLTSELIRQISDVPVSSYLQSDESLSGSLGDDLDSFASAHGHPQARSDYDALLNMAVRGFQAELEFDQADFLRERIEIRTLYSGDVIMTEDSHQDAALVYILSGSLMLSQRAEQESNGPDKVLYTAYRGECVGQLAMLTGEANFYSCQAKEPSQVAILTRETFFEIVCETPEMVLSLAHQIISRLSPLVRQVDFALDWINIESGKALYRQNEPTDGTFIVLSGRLRSVLTSNSAANSQNGQPDTRDSGSSTFKRQLVDEYARGDMVGLVDVVTATNRLTSVMAVRDSELCKIPANLLNLLKTRYPVVVSRLISLLGHRLLGTWNHGHGASTPSATEKDAPSFQASYTTVAVHASCGQVPLSTFCWELAHSLTVSGPVVILNSAMVTEKLGVGAFEAGHDYRLNAWLGLQEHRHKVVIYMCDREMTLWTRRCLRQADVIFDLVLPDEQGPEVTRQEKALEATAKRVRKELILIHPESTLCPKNTREWLRRRPWVSSHFHLKGTKRLFNRRRNEQRLRELYQRLMHNQAPNIHSDFSRLARHITGTSVGLVLGGGGARGAAHIGMIRAIQEAGIPIDRLGGVSIGAFVGGLWGSSRDMTLITQKARYYFELLGNRYLRPALDFTYPLVSLFSGHYFNWTLKEIFGTELCIEDLWLPFFCCTTDISCSQERVHTRGIFWSYCRASMSYAWLLPPLCDPEDGHLLMDGCYVNNVPGDIMAQQGCKYILAIDVTAIDDRDLTNYGDTLSGTWLLLQKLNPFASPLKIPNQSEIQMRLAFCSHYQNLEQLRSNPNYEYIQPPVGKYASGAFKQFDEIRDAGYHHGSTFFTGLRKAGQSTRQKLTRQGDSQSHHSHAQPGTSPPWFPGADHHLWQWTRQKAASNRRDSGSYNFTDLAQMVFQNLSSRDVALGAPGAGGGSNSPFRSRSGSQASSSARVRRRIRSGDSRLSRNSSTASLKQKQSKVRRATVGLRPQNLPQLYYGPPEDDSDDTGIVL